MARPYPKRAAGVAMINAIGGLSNLWASYLYYDGPWYYAAFGCSEYSYSSLIKARYIKPALMPRTLATACAVVFLVTITGYLIWVRRMNKLLDGSEEDQQKVLKSGVTQQQVDLGWRYLGY